MKNRTVIAIVIVALALFAFIYFVDDDAMTTDELESRGDSVFEEFKRELVDRVSITGTSGEQVVVVRSPDEGSAEDTWVVTSPSKLAADGTEVRAVLSALDYLLKDRVVSKDGASADPRYGLDKPRIKGSFTIRGNQTSFSIGADDATGEKVYLAIDGNDGEFYAVETDFFNSINKGLSDLRDKHLIDGGLSNAVSVKTKVAGATLFLHRKSEEHPWKIDREGTKVCAVEDQVSQLLRKMGDLRATSFVSDNASDSDLDKYGLADGGRRTVFSTPDRGEIIVAVGAPCSREENTVHATVVGSGIVACVEREIETILDRTQDRYTLMKPADFHGGDVEKITIDRDGSSMVLNREDLGVWSAQEADTEIDQDTVSAFLTGLTEAEAASISFGDAAVDNLGDPSATITVELDSGGGTRVLEFHQSAGANAELVRRKGENATLFLPADKGLMESVRADALAFRKREIENGHVEDIIGLEITGPASQKLQKKDGDWMITEPMELAADRTLAESLSKKFAKIEIVRFEPSTVQGTKKTTGLDSPWATIAGRFVKHREEAQGEDQTGEERTTMHIGAVAGEEGRYAQIKDGDGAVFVIGTAFTTLLERPMVARDLLQIGSDEITKIRLTSGAKTLLAVLESNDWKSEDADLDSVTLKRLVTDLGATKAIRADSFHPKTGFEEPFLAVEIWTAKEDDESKPSKLIFGEKTPDPNEDGYLAKWKGVDVSMVIPARVVDGLHAIAVSAD